MNSRIRTTVGIVVLIVLIGLAAALAYIINTSTQAPEDASAGAISCGAGVCNDDFEFGADCNAGQSSCDERNNNACDGHGGIKSGGGPIDCGDGGGGDGGGGGDCVIDNPSATSGSITITAGCQNLTLQIYSRPDNAGGSCFTSDNGRTQTVSGPASFDPKNYISCGQCGQIDIQGPDGRMYGTCTCSSACTQEETTTCYRCTASTTDDNACESRSVSGNSCPAGWSTNSACEQAQDGQCPIASAQCGEDCTTDAECGDNHVCDAGTCKLTSCAENPESCLDGTCSPVNPQCGETCSNDTQCPTDHTCDIATSTCILNECVNNGNCTNNGCTPPLIEILPQTDLSSDEWQRLIMGAVIIMLGMIAYKVNIYGTLENAFHKAETGKKIKTKKEFEDSVAK